MPPTTWHDPARIDPIVIALVITPRAIAEVWPGCTKAETMKEAPLARL